MADGQPSQPVTTHCTALQAVSISVFASSPAPHWWNRIDQMTTEVAESRPADNRACQTRSHLVMVDPSIVGPTG